MTTFETWKAEHSQGLAKGSPIWAENMAPGLTINEQDKWKRGLRPTVGMDCWSADDDGWREQAAERAEFQSLQRERDRWESGRQ